MACVYIINFIAIASCIVVHLTLHAIALHRMQILIQIGTSGIYAAFQMIKMSCTRYEVL